MANIKLSFSRPKHGWLPVTFIAGNEIFEFAASDVPNNPVEELISALYAVQQNRDAQVWWHLEPGGYYFEFKPVDNYLLFSVLFKEDSSQNNSSKLLALKETKENILLPIWRGLRQLQTFNEVEPHWPKVDYKDLDKFGELLHANSPR